MLKRNLIANYLGQGWAALMGLAFIPLYIKYIGIEAYGLIGLFAVLQAWFILLDMGMTPTLSREMARFTGGGRTAESIRDLLRSIEIIGLGIASLIVGGVALGSNWIATSWLQAENLPVDVVAQAFVIMGLVAALRFVEGIYRSCIVGLQRQVLFNLITSVMATLRGLGAVAILAWVSPTIEAFFLWQGLMSIVTLGILAIATYATLPRAVRGGRFSLQVLRGVWRFAGGMLGITFLATLLTQVDKILLSKLLSLSEYGYYTLAVVVSSAVFILITPITQALYPRLCELHARDDLVRDGHSLSPGRTVCQRRRRQCCDSTDPVRRDLPASLDAGSGFGAAGCAAAQSANARQPVEWADVDSLPDPTCTWLDQSRSTNQHRRGILDSASDPLGNTAFRRRGCGLGVGDPERLTADLRGSFHVSPYPVGRKMALVYERCPCATGHRRHGCDWRQNPSPRC